MAAVQPPTLLSLALHEGQPSGGTRFGRLFLVSVALHCGFLSLVGILRVPDTGYHPFAAQDVMLVSIAEAHVIKAPLATRVVKEKPAPKKTALATPPKLEPKVAPPVPERVPPPRSASARTYSGAIHIHGRGNRGQSPITGSRGRSAEPDTAATDTCGEAGFSVTSACHHSIVGGACGARSLDAVSAAVGERERGSCSGAD